MTGPFEVQAEWGPRAEGPAELAARLVRMLELLAGIHPAFARWNQMAETREEADAPFCAMPPRLSELTRIWVEAKARAADEQVVAWNAIETALGASFAVRAGMDYLGIAFPNRADLQFSRPSRENASLLNFPVMRSVVRAVVDAWEPEVAMLEPFTFCLNNDPENFARPHGGWIVYLDNTFARMISPPIGLQTESMADGGILMVAAPELFDSDNPEHAAGVRKIHAALKPIQEKIEAAFPPPKPRYGPR